MAAPLCSVFQPHHTTTIKYPELSLLQSDEETFALALVHDAENRYEPKGLVDDVAVQHHAGRMNFRECSFFSISPAFFGNTTLWSTAGSMSDDKRLLHDMRLAISGNGVTTLDVVTYTRPRTDREKEHHVCIGGSSEDLEEISMIRFARDTTFTTDRHGTAEDYSDAQYTMPLSDFDAIDIDEQWLENIRDLLTQRSDRAARLVALMLKVQDREIPQTPWKPARTAKFETELDKVTKRADILALDDEERHCVSCTEDLVDGDALALLCNDRHVLCRQCLLQWCQNQGPSTVGCPHCRQKVFTDPKAIDSLKFGTTGKSYEFDERYNSFENFERSYADLDHYLAENSTAVITVYAGILTQAWKEIAATAGEESVEATPWHLQPYRAPEFEMVAQAFETAVWSIDGAKVPVKELWKLVLDDINRDLVRALIRSPHGRKRHETTSLALDHSPKGIRTLRCYLRIGFAEFFERTLSRTLQYAHLRVCKCGKGKKVFHQHGLRSYYNHQLATGIDKDYADLTVVSKRYRSWREELVSLRERIRGLDMRHAA